MASKNRQNRLTQIWIEPHTPPEFDLTPLAWKELFGPHARLLLVGAPLALLAVLALKVLLPMFNVGLAVAVGMLHYMAVAVVAWGGNKVAAVVDAQVGGAGGK